MDDQRVYCPFEGKYWATAHEVQWSHGKRDGTELVFKDLVCFGKARAPYPRAGMSGWYRYLSRGRCRALPVDIVPDPGGSAELPLSAASRGSKTAGEFFISHPDLIQASRAASSVSAATAATGSPT